MCAKVQPGAPGAGEWLRIPRRLGQRPSHLAAGSEEVVNNGILENSMWSIMFSYLNGAQEVSFFLGVMLCVDSSGEVVSSAGCCGIIILPFYRFHER